MFNGIIYNTGTIKTIKKKKNSIYIGVNVKQEEYKRFFI